MTEIGPSEIQGQAKDLDNTLQGMGSGDKKSRLAHSIVVKGLALGAL